MEPEYSNNNLKRSDILYPELSYSILGSSFEVYNELGWGHKEIVYQRALETVFKKRNISFEREKYVPLSFQGNSVGKTFLDFIVEGKVIVELKVMPQMGYTHINQVVGYLAGTNLKLAILLYFLKNGVRYRRVLRKK